MKKIKLNILLILALLPINTISLAAYAKASEIDNEIQNQRMINYLKQLRHKLISSDQAKSNLNDALIRYQNQTGYFGENLHNNFKRDLDLLVQKGIIQIQIDGAISGSPSDS